MILWQKTKECNKLKIKEIFKKLKKKIVDYCKSKPHGNNQVITQGDIDNNITFSAEIKVFELVNSISQKKRSESIKLYKRLAANGESPLFIFNLIEKQISMMLLYLDGEASGKRKELRATFGPLWR